ncbi:MAG: STAS-like domain-containing protein [Myxococcota bacterium]
MVDDSDREILAALRDGPASSTELAARLGISRQATYERLRRLVQEGRVVREGAARATRYRLPEEPAWAGSFPLEGLAEDRVFELLEADVPLLAGLAGNAANVVTYVVTEVVNNAIDHSSGQRLRIRVNTVGTALAIEVEDDGVGAFAHIRDALALPSELAALQELSKGKTTTAPDRHTGEGLFFVSKAVDHFRLESGTLAWIVDNERQDVAVAAVEPPRRGTLVRLELDVARARDLTAIFDEYTQDYEFSKTRTIVRLFAIGVRFISRSEAKRLLQGLDRFREVVLDFRGVEAVGQGFADEVFRVWAKAHPDVSLVPVNMNEAVELMVRRAFRPKP